MPGSVHQLAAECIRQPEDRADQGAQLQGRAGVAVQGTSGGEVQVTNMVKLELYSAKTNNIYLSHVFNMKPKINFMMNDPLINEEHLVYG